MNKKQKIQFFNNEVKKFIKFFGMLDWRIEIGIEDDNNSRASCITWSLNSNNSDAQVGQIYCNQTWISENKLTKEEISQTAFHEVLELLFSNLCRFGREKNIYVSDREIDTEKHRIIRIFENTVFPKIDKKN